MEEQKKEKKPFNVVLLGNIESEKAALLHKFIKKRFAIKKLKELNISSENGEEDSKIDEIMNNVEIHGETVHMKIWDNVSANKIFSSSNKSLKVAQGIILFYSVSDRKSFNMLKLSLSNIIDIDKYDIPMVMVGNDSEDPNREVSYEEAKALADSYGINFYESSIKSGMNKVFEDIGEQVFYQEYGANSNYNYNINSKHTKNNYSLSTSKSTNKLNNKISIYSKNDFYENDFNNKLKSKIGKNISIFNLSKGKSSNKKYNNNVNKNKDNKELASDDINLNLDDSIQSFQTNNVKLSDTNNNKKSKKNSLIIKSPDILMNSSILNNSSSIIFSYQSNTQAQKIREEEIREKRLKKEEEMKSWWKKREKENLERNKLKKLKEKEDLQKKIKQDKMNQKEKEKKVMEENLTKVKNNYEQKKKSIKETEKEIMANKENKKIMNLLEKRSNKEKLNKMKEEKEKEIKTILNNRSIYNKNKNSKKSLMNNKSDDNFNRHKNNENKLRGKNGINKNNKSVKKVKNESLNTSIITQDEQELIKQNFEIKNKLIEKYQNHSNIYRCLKCNLIPNIIINENNQEIETYCDKSYNDMSHYNITTYSYFQDLSLNHPIDNNNILCYYCNKAINELSSQQTIYYCCKCDIFFCTEDEELHKNQNHKPLDTLKEKYLELSKNKLKIFDTKKNNILSTPSQNKKIKLLSKQNSTPFLLNKNNNKNIKKNIQQAKVKNISKNHNENLNNNSILNESLNNNSMVLSDKFKEKKKSKNYSKIQIYLIDSYCNIHNEIYKSYCFNCHKNLCDICEENHSSHKSVKFEEIFLDEQELTDKKNELNKAKEELMKINEYFSALIEAIKCKFERLFNIKKKELDIKEKIIKDYETIQYNYQCINNVRNIKFDNNKTFIDKSSNTDWLHRFNLIFRYFNSDLNIKNNNNDFFDIINNRTEKNNIKIITNKFKDLIINKLIVLKNEDIAICSNNNIIIYDKDNLNEKLNIKNNSDYRVDDFFEKEGGGIVCFGQVFIKIINFTLNNKSYDIIKQKILNDKKTSIHSIVELYNNSFISLYDNCTMKLWKIDKLNNIKIIDRYTLTYNNLKVDDNLLFKINNNLFLFYSFKICNLSIFEINDYEKIEFKKTLQDLKIIKGKNTIIKFPDEDYLILSCVEYDAQNYFCEKDSYIDINNKNTYYYEGEYSIKIFNINNFTVVGKYKNSYAFIDIKYYMDNIIIALDTYGIIRKLEYDKYQRNLISLDTIKYNNDFILEAEKINSIYISKNRKSLILELNNKIMKISNFD